MKKIDEKELRRIAHLSGIRVDANNVEILTQQVDKVLIFIDELKAVNITTSAEPVHNINIFRDDVAQPSDSAPIREAAPQKSLEYFVVPSILEKK